MDCLDTEIEHHVTGPSSSCGDHSKQKQKDKIELFNVLG